MGEQKSGLMTTIIGVGAIILILVIAAIFFFSKKDSPQTEAASVEPTTIATTTAKATSNSDLYQIVDKDSVLKSDDAGETFTPYFAISTSGKIGVANILSVAFHPITQGKIIVSSYEDGLFIKESGENVWNVISFPPKQIYSFILDKKNPDKRMFASGVVEKNGRIFRTDDGGKNWKAVYVEPGDSTVISALSQNPSQPNIIFSGTSQGTIVKSVDGGNTWRNIGNKITGVIKNICFDATKQQSTYLLSFQSKIYYSSDGGSKWIDWEEEKMNEVNEMNKRANDLTVAGNFDGANELRKQANALMTRNMENKMPTGVNLIAADPKTSGTIYAGTNSGLYRSVDFGKYWYELDIIESARSYPIKSIAVNPKDSKEIVFVAGKAFYKSTNSGATWSVTPLSADRNASFVAYDPFNTKTIFIGVSSI